MSESLDDAFRRLEATTRRPDTLTESPPGADSAPDVLPARPQTTIPRPGGGPQTPVPGSESLDALLERLRPYPVGPAATKPAATGGLLQRGMESAGGMVTGFFNHLLAGEQGVKTDPGQAKLAPQKEQYLLSEQQTVSDPRKYFAARDPNTGRMAAFERSPETEADIPERLSQLGHVVGPGMVATPQGITQQLPRISPAQQATEEFRQAGVRPSVPGVTGGGGPFTRLGRNLPFSPMPGGFSRAEQDIEAAAQRLATRYGTAADQPPAAGAVIRNALTRYAGDKTQAAKDYGEFDRLMFGAKPAPVSNTLKALNDLEGKFPNAPELEHVFANPKLRVMSQSLTPRTETIPARTSPIVGPSGQPIITAPAQTVQRGGVLTMPELKELRTRIGYLIEHPSTLSPDQIPKADLRRVYAAVTNDLQAAARTVGPAAVKALNRATISYGVRMRTMERLEPLVKSDSNESVFQKINAAASAGGSADSQLLSAAKRAMQPQEWNEVSGAIIRRLGRPTTPTAIRDPAANPEFSLKTFTDNWHKLSGRAKDELFGQDVVGSPRAGMEQLYRVARTQAGAQRGTTLGRAAVGGGVAAVVVDHVISGLMQGRFPWAEAAGLATTYGVSKLLMSPRFTQWLYRMPNMVANAPSTEAAIAQGGALLQQAISGGGLPPQQDPPNPVQPTRPPTPAQRQKQSDLSWDRHFANRRGDLTEFQKLNRQLA